MFKKIDRLVWTPINWIPVPESKTYFVSESFPAEEYYLRLNDFPYEPLWTLFIKGKLKILMTLLYYGG